MSIFFVVLIVVILLVLWIVGSYNSLIKFRNRAQEAWGDIDVQLKRRYDLIPNLIETVKAYTKHERDTLEAVTKARTAAMSAKSPEAKGQAENMITEALKSIFAVAENYPELKASDNYRQLQDELTDTEDKIEAARRFYNGNVRDLNTALQTFPTNIIGSSFHLEPMNLFSATDPEREVPKVSFTDSDGK